MPSPPKTMQTNNSKRVAILAYPELCTFEFGCAVELFALPRPELQHRYDTDIIAIQAGAIKATGGFSVESDLVFKATKNNDYFNAYDRVVIAGWTGPDFKAPEDLLCSLRHFYNSGGSLVSFCGGAFVLADTGLLNGKNATTHWRYENQFKQQFPQIQFQENVLYTEEERLYTSAGSAAGLDLGLHLIRQDFGASTANEIAKRLVISPQREGGQAQYANKIATPQDTHHLSKSIQWAHDNLSANISIDEMATQACLSRRSFDRHFRNQLGQSPKEWLIQQRINLAREFLESSQATIEHIAEQTGFGSAMNLRHHFNHVLGISPTHYRNQYLHG